MTAPSQVEVIALYHDTPPPQARQSWERACELRLLPHPCTALTAMPPRVPIAPSPMTQHVPAGLPPELQQS